MVRERYFFDIPVCSCRSDTFYKRQKDRIQKYLDDLVIRSGGITHDQAPDVFAFAEERLRQQAGAWTFNQVIGWIRLYILGDQIRGEYWFVEGKHIRYEMSKKQYTWRSKAFEVICFRDQSSSDIYAEVCRALDEVSQEPPFTKRFIELESFHNLGSFVDWRRLIWFDE